MINLTTGPVEQLPEVTEALANSCVSHRSEDFVAMHQQVVQTLCRQLQVQQTYILTGSGTLANEVMLAQIGLRNEPGLILSNGEFGERLINQANRHQLNFLQLKKNWGETFDLEKVILLLAGKNIRWLLFCHCESSTGIINQLEEITQLAKLYNCAVYVDCMSSFATRELNLQDVAMATASTGKAIGAIAGLALVFTNVKVLSGKHLPMYLDLLHFENADGIPFTISSRLLAALNKAVQLNLNPERWKTLDDISNQIYHRLNFLEVIPFAKPDSRIFTIVLKNTDAKKLGDQLLKQGIQLSYQSSYLVKRNWIELALFGCYKPEQIDFVLNELVKTLQTVVPLATIQE